MPDLEKMLLLSASDKGVQDGLPCVTGRFGLGFKSVFLFADRAAIWNGRLACDVVGGLYPRQLSQNGARFFVKSSTGRGWDETTVLLFIFRLR